MPVTRDADPQTLHGGRPLIRLQGVTRRFGDVAAVDRLDLDIRDGEFFALLGPSGCGKTTLLRLLAGFEHPDEGRILLDGKNIIAVPPHRRPFNMMFQNYALFPHLTAAGNVGFGLKQEGLPRAEIDRRVAELLAMVRLEGYGARKPHQLSGGQRQRIALARALAKRPRVLLLDEPMAALDRKLREQTQFELMELQAALGLTFVIVTHDQDEAMTVAHRIAVMDRGRIAQVSTPRTIYEQPASRWVARFIGEVNLLEGVVAESGEEGVVEGEAGRFRVAPVDAPRGARVCIALRPEKIRIAATPPFARDNHLAGTVVDVGYLGGLSVYKVRVAGGATIRASISNASRKASTAIARGDAVHLTWTPDAGVLIPE